MKLYARFLYLTQFIHPCQHPILAYLVHPLNRTVRFNTYTQAMRNWVLLGLFLGLFSFLVASYPSYSDNTFAVAAAAAVILYSGLAVWVVSIRRGKSEDEE